MKFHSALAICEWCILRLLPAFVRVMPLQGSLDDVEALMKRHEDFENTLFAQDERLKAFSELADKLIQAGHYDSK